MNLEQQKDHFADMSVRMAQIMLKKGDDYAGDVDRLNNFKVAGAAAGNSAAINCLNLIATKVARLGILLRSEKGPKNESIRDSVVDLANYAVLLDMILSEEGYHAS